MGSSERRERERRELRERILDAARELLVTHGYEAVTMREIAKRIEYSATALYGHFADKETLVRELCREDFAAFSQTFLENALESADPMERMCRAGLVYLSFAQRYPQHYRLMFMTELPEAPPTEDERKDPALNAYAMLRMLVEDLAKGGELRPEWSDVDLVAQTVWAAMHGAAALDLSTSRTEPWTGFKARAERFQAALEFVMWAIARDPVKGVRKLHRVIAERALTNALRSHTPVKAPATPPRKKKRAKSRDAAKPRRKER